MLLVKMVFLVAVKLALELKLTSLGHISLDGPKFKANFQASR